MSSAEAKAKGRRLDKRLYNTIIANGRHTAAFGMNAENEKQKSSPRINHVSWGRMEVEGLRAGRDFKLYPGGGRPWDWRETGTHHVPGIQPSDIQELLDHGSKVVILSRGLQLALQTCPETLQLLSELGINYHDEYL